MQIDVLVTWVLAGLITGCLARLVVNVGGYGLAADLLLGLAGSSVGSAIVSAFAPAPEAGYAAVIGIAFVGAASMIGAQRLWYRGA